MRAEEADRRGEQSVDRDLDVRAHVVRKLAHHRYELVRRGIGEMPGQRIGGPLELDVVRVVGLRFVRGFAGDLKRKFFLPDAFLRRIEQRLCN